LVKKLALLKECEDLIESTERDGFLSSGPTSPKAQGKKTMELEQ
jgi:hypothetical protein